MFHHLSRRHNVSIEHLGNEFNRRAIKVLQVQYENLLYLSDKRDDSLCAIFVHVWQIDLITE